ncbi:uncharacterized protein BDZ99DRAFT_497008 [Mytilinidion resinicola]|uniref:Uncharacterized protein n=1 Tax=Mytilinidion resinicola TaxID=574789 RepID=A0A6A6YUK3_9PEZI|nr:uncharacterized protein BDZ99DRAFT_497008 [Mytilinidion resinicola]KAF2812636.1 hypothetical protein BDZ99DRAFT_497008 [Mytilinidion resinicola]
MAPSPRKTASTFDQTWHETDVNFLNPASLPLQKIPRAWERAPKSPYARDRGYKKVWHKHGLRSHSTGEQTSTTNAGDEEQDMSRSPTRAVKKLRLKNEDALGNNVTIETKKPAFSATRWDRRKSGLPRKKPHQTTLDLEDLEPADGQVEDAASEPDDQEGAESAAFEHDSMLQPENATINQAATAHAASSRVSLSSTANDSTFSFIFGEHDEEPSTRDNGSYVELDHICNSSSPSAAGENELGTDETEFTISTDEVVMNSDVLPIETPISPIPQHPQSPPHQILADTCDAVDITGVSVGTSVLEQATSFSATVTSPLDQSEPFLEQSEVGNMEEETSAIGLEAMMETSILVQATASIVPEHVTWGQPEQSEPALIDNIEEDAIVAEHDCQREVSEATEEKIKESCNHPQTLDESEIDWESDNDVDAVDSESAIQDTTVVQEVELVGDGPAADIEEPCSEPQSLDDSDINWESDSEIEAVVPESTIQDKTVTRDAETQGATISENDSPSKDDHGLEITESPDVAEHANESTTEVLEESTIEETLNIENETMELAERQVSTETSDESRASHVAGGNVEELVLPTTTTNADEESTLPGDDDMAIDSIADGLTLAPPSDNTLISEQTEPKLRSPARPARLEVTQDDLTAHLDDDTALLKDFLTRAAASKLNKAHKAATIARRSSLSHRRDSDVIRHALASPRKILEDKDVNSPSPQKSYDDTATLDLTQTLTLDPTPSSPTADSTPEDADVAGVTKSSSRRSTRTRKSRIPPPSSHAQQQQTPKSIPVRRVDGGEPIVLRRTEAQELGILTRTNTRKNKMGAVSAYARVLKLATEKPVSPGSAIDESADGQREGAAAGERKSVKWDETLVYFQENAKGEVLAVEAPADIEMVDAPGEEATTLSISAPSAKPTSKAKDKSSSTPRVRRLRRLGAANGTPGKGLLEPASLLPEEVQAEVAEEKKKIVKPRARKPPVATSGDATPPAAKIPKLDIAAPTPPSPEEQETKEIKERKSRIATPRKGKIPVSKTTTTTVPVDGKENRLATGLPKKALGVEGGLPRRRAPRASSTCGAYGESFLYKLRRGVY